MTKGYAFSVFTVKRSRCCVQCGVPGIELLGKVDLFRLVKEKACNKATAAPSFAWRPSKFTMKPSAVQWQCYKKSLSTTWTKGHGGLQNMTTLQPYRQEERLQI